MAHNIFVFLATFLASAVEAVEALTIVLAVGVVRGWRSTLIGVGAATLVLAAVVAALGPALQHIPIGTLRFVVGALLLAFGLQWLRKAILRAERLQAASRRGRGVLARARAGRRGRGCRLGRIDWYSFTVAFKGVLLEGLEVAFIVVTFGATQGRLGLAAAAAAAAACRRGRRRGCWCAGRSSGCPRTRSSSSSGSCSRASGSSGAARARASNGRAATSRSSPSSPSSARLLRPRARPPPAAARATGPQAARA